MLEGADVSSTIPVALESTLGEVLSALLKAQARHNRNDMVAPKVILWPDKAEAWARIVPSLQARLPILTLGRYRPDERSGPAIWLRCVIDGSLENIELPAGTPILYLPGVSRTDLRAVESCPKPLRPLAELQYRGVFFSQPSHRDWSPAALLAQAGIRIAEDAGTKVALARVLPRLLLEPVANLLPLSPLNADTLNGLLTPDPQQLLLSWLNDPEGTKATLDLGQGEAWASFRERAKMLYGFDPDEDGEITAARLLAAPPANRAAQWELVWGRFVDTPRRYPNLPALLRRAKPSQGLFDSSPVWPQDNEEAEGRLRQDLTRLHNLPLNEAITQLTRLEAEHASRRDWIWAHLGAAPLAGALEALVALGKAVATPLGAGTPAELAERYTSAGWQVDALALQVMAAGRTTADSGALNGALRAIYRPWLEAAAISFQQAVAGADLPPPRPDPEALPGRCWLFSDGLRFDIAQRLRETLAAGGFVTTLEWQFSALPGVTSTAKPAVSPVADELSGASEFSASYRGSKVTVEVLRRALGNAGFEILQGGDLGDGSAAWTEFGNFDALGHAQGWRLAQQVEGEVTRLGERIGALLDAGFREVKVVTDHGWLLLPGGLDKLDLPLHLTEARKGRCARLKPGVATNQPTVPWRFDADVQIAVAPGLGVYVSGQDYEHGGLSLQECVLPVLKVTKPAVAATADLKVEVRWAGLRCRLEVSGAPPGAIADLRTRAADASTSLAQAPKALSNDGKASLVVPDDTLIGHAAHLVLLTPDGNLLTQQATTVGG